MNVVFYLSAFVALVCTVLVISSSHAVHALLYLIVSLLAVALIFFVLGAPFAAALEVIVYAGAIMVLIIFVIMLLNIKTETGRRGHHAIAGAGVLGIFLLFLTCWFLIKGSSAGVVGPMNQAMIEQVGHIELIGKALYTDFLLPFEVTSLLLLAAIIGAVILAKKKI